MASLIVVLLSLFSAAVVVMLMFSCFYWFVVVFFVVCVYKSFNHMIIHMNVQVKIIQDGISMFDEENLESEIELGSREDSPGEEVNNCNNESNSRDIALCSYPHN